ncbi:MAG: hypothetical protein COX07_00320 [Bacteroidetes bacterium CG23_combo_of_CG06-09_8_20_14_all_32_9]|nr:MAG: hypothetical protein COX07_00320 [Bacteroidetes bacterium CG23_combo_of_CG06-09_8_20_14_all_32_9]
MIKITEQQINDIASDLDCGMRCFYNKQTGEIKSFPTFDSGYIDEELWEEEQKELDENWSDYLEFENFTSSDSFEIMVDFAKNVDNARLRNKLINSLHKSKPFRNFKWHIDNSGDYRQKWFDFKNNRYIEFVKNQLEQFYKIKDNE